MKETDLMVMMVLDGQAEVTQGLLEPAAGHAAFVSTAVLRNCVHTCWSDVSLL
jgi:hypothetical protein